MGAIYEDMKNKAVLGGGEVWAHVIKKSNMAVKKNKMNISNL